MQSGRKKRKGPYYDVTEISTCGMFTISSVQKGVKFQGVVSMNVDNIVIKSIVTVAISAFEKTLGLIVRVWKSDNMMDPINIIGESTQMHVIY